MDLCKKIQLWLLTLLVVPVAVTSCSPQGTGMPREKSESNDSAGERDRKECVLSKEQIIDAANAAIRLHGCALEDYEMIYDDENPFWKRYLYAMATLPPDLEGRDCHIVVYTPRPDPNVFSFGGDILVMVDKSTGAVLRFYQTQ